MLNQDEGNCVKEQRKVCAILAPTTPASAEQKVKCSKGQYWEVSCRSG